MAYQDGFRQGVTGLDPLAALREPITSLLGVSAEAASALGSLGIVTVFDLATAPVFQVAREIAEMAEGRGNSAMARLGIVPGGLLDSGRVIAPEALAAAPVADLNAVDDAQASALTAQLQVEAIGELGRWSAFRAAQEVLAAATVPDSSDDGAGELVPRLGEFPTERRFYQSVIIDHVAAGQTTDLAAAGPVDISPTVGAGFGFAAPAVGARLTFAQSWFAHSVTLGNLLHSVALAAGESTRIAMLDWSQQISASGTEDITQAEQLTQATSHNRAVSEVQDAVAQEAQTGFSQTHAEASTISGGGGFGLSLGRLTLGGSVSGSGTTSDAWSFSASTGSRNLAASMNQKVMDSTQQAASSVRNRRASIVKEVSEQEHEAVSTRIVANYNHMHALTVQYFEVVELYRVSTHLHQVERCLFVPMKLVNFTDTLVAHYRGVLADAVLDQRARELLTTEYGVVRVHPVLPMRRPINVFGHLTGVQVMALSTSPATAPATPAPDGPPSGAPGSAAAASAASSAAGTGPAAAASAAAAAASALATSAPGSWSAGEMARAARIIAAGPARPGTSDLFLPDDAELAGISFSGAAPDGSAVPINAVQVRLRTGEARHLTAAGPTDWSLATPVPLQDIEDVRVSSSATARFDGQITLQLSYHGARFPLTAPLAVAGQAVLTEVLAIGAPESGAELLEHLQQNQLHYSQAIWRSLDASSIALLLSAYSFESLPVADLIDPNPIMIAGNYVVFRMPGFTRTAGLQESPNGASASDAETAIRKSWDAWLTTRGLVLGADVAAEELVSVPTGGVFAEAVLGRSNAAELLDATRFWNWQDSPIPLQPPEIAAIQMQSRAQPTDVTPGQLGAPVLNIMNPTALPDPAGLAPTLAALQNGNMFRDMSGLAATVGLAQALGQATSTAATEAGKQAAANLAVAAQKDIEAKRIAAQKDIEEKRIAAQLGMTAMSAPGGGSGTPMNISESGALLNTAKAMDTQAPKGQPTTGSSNPSSSGGGGPHMPSASGSLQTAGSGSRADDVLRRALWGSLGIPGADIIPAALGSGSGSGSGGTGSAGMASATSPFRTSVPNALTPDHTLQTAFDPNASLLSNINPGLTGKEDAAVVIVALSDSPTDPRPYAGNGSGMTDMYYSGSMLKNAAMYAAYQLRAAMNDLGPALTDGSDTDIFKQVSNAFDAQMRAAVPRITKANKITSDMLTPKYDQIFTITHSSPITFDFKTGPDDWADTDHSDPDPTKWVESHLASTFYKNLRRMIVGSHNDSAGVCIRALGYNTINGALQSAGLFKPTTGKGIWLAGDYANWQVVTVNSLNDGPVKQATTCLDMARLLVLINDDNLVENDVHSHPDTGNLEMKDLLEDAVGDPGAPSLLKRAATVPFTVLQSKIGVGELKGGSCTKANRDRCTYSEAAVVQHSSGRKFAVVFQNLVFLKDNPTAWNDGLQKIVDAISKTIDAYP
jgi:hypothetical protein